jgi:hypothetical protein
MLNYLLFPKKRAGEGIAGNPHPLIVGLTETARQLAVLV